MAKRLNVELGFTADTSQAKRQIDDLVSQLQKIQTGPSKLFDTSQFQAASKAAQELQQHIQGAVNVDTGKLDLTKFANSLNKSKTNLSTYRKELEKIGPEGEKAFAALSNSIAQADAPILKLNGRLGEFVTTLKNSARWQISSNILHGFESSLASAFGYAKDLDESLNSIRIVTGQSTDQMASFAKEANEAAKALNTTTTNYTDASLIYYQQGLSDEEVKKRTDITVKMGNVAQESAEQVSQYMTAIWENYYDGSEALESYADKITALGAATASSSKEIANGLDKFVSVGKQIGLSYDYATAALTTIIAKTRQSEDVVGTALKTIFARIQGFNLGETADDGVTLNKYSSALASVGVNVLDVNGKMKDMDTILDETAAKWGSLSTAQQNALSQTVAGVRQYTQFSTLMNNWDFMKENLQTIEESGGALQKQADIYADSWEAARKRVKASLEDIYDSLIDRDGMTALNNMLADVLDLLSDVIDGFGGLYGILLTISGFVATKMAKEMPNALTSIRNALSFTTGAATLQAQNIQSANAKEMRDIADNSSYTDNQEYKTQIEGMAKVNEMKANLAKVSKTLSDQEKVEYQNRIQNTEALYKMIEAEAKELEQQKKRNQESRKNLVQTTARKSTPINDSNGQAKDRGIYVTEIKNNEKAISSLIDKYAEYKKAYEQVGEVKNQFADQIDIWSKEGLGVEEIQKKLEGVLENLNKMNLIIHDSEGNEIDFISSDDYKLLENFIEKLRTGKVDADQLKQELEDLVNRFVGSGSEDNSAVNAEKTAEVLVENYNMNRDALDQYADSVNKTAENEQRLVQSRENVNNSTQTSINHNIKLSETLTSVAGSLAMVSGAATSVSNAIQVWNNKDANIAEKLTATISALSSVMFALNSISQSNTIIKQAMTAASVAHTTAVNAEASALTRAATASKAFFASMIANPYTWVMIGIGALITGLMTLANAEEAAAQKSQELYDAHIEKAEQNNEEAKSVQELTKTYLEAKQSYDEIEDKESDGVDQKIALDDATRKLADALNEQYEALKDTHDELSRVNTETLIATGNYRDLEAAVRAATKARLKDQKSEATSALRETEESFKNGMIYDSIADYDENKGYSYKREGYEADDYEADKYFAELFDKRKDEFEHIKYSTAEDGTGTLEVFADNTVEDMVKAREEVAKLYEELRNDSNASPGLWEKLLSSSYMDDLKTIIDETEDSYENVAKAVEKIADAEEQLAFQDVLENYLIDDKDVKNGQDYLQLIKDIATQMAKEKTKQKLIDEGKIAYAMYDLQPEHKVEKEAGDTELTYANRYAEEVFNSNAQQYAEEFYQSGEEAAKAAGLYTDAATEYEAAKGKIDAVSDEGAKEEAQSFFENLNPEDNKYFVEIDFDSGKTQENYEKQLAVLKAQDAFKVNLDIGSSISEAAKAIKDGKLSEVEDMFDWGEGPLIKFEEFAEKSTSEQMAYLLDIGRNTVQNLEVYKNQAIQIFQEASDAYEKQYNDYLNAGNEEAANQVLQLKNDLDALIDTYSSYDGSDVNLSGETDENVMKQMDDYTKLIYLMTTTEQLSGDLQEELANLIATADGFDIADRFSLLQDALAADKISVLDLKGALDEIISNGGVNLDDLQKFQEDLSADPFIEAKDAVSIYVSGLQELAAQYDNCTKELNDYQIALQTNNETLIANTQANLELATRVGEDAELYDIDTERLESLTRTYLEEAESLEAVQKGLMSAEEAAENMARADIRANDAVSALYDMQDDITKLMKEYNEALAENASTAASVTRADKNLSKIISEVKSNVAGLLDTSSKLLDDDWILENMDKIQAAAAGDQEALESLKNSSTVEVLINSNLDDLGIDVDDLADKINNLPDGEIHLDKNTWLQDTVDLLSQAGMTAEQIQDLFSAAGIDLNFEPAVESMNAVGAAAAVAGVAAGANWADNLAEASETNVDLEAKTFTDTDNQEAAGFTSTLQEVPKIGTFTVPITDGDRIYPRQYGLPYTVYSQITTPDVTNEDVSKETTVTNPKISSANKKGAGKITRTNLPGGSNKSGGSGGGGKGKKGGNGGGSGSTPRPQRFTPSRQVDTKGLIKDNTKKLKDEQERYHLINSELKMISKNLADIDQVKSRAFGKNKLNAMKAENKELTTQAKKQAELLAQTREYLKQDRKKVKALGATIGDDGSITNYDALTSGWVEEYNKGIKSWAKQQKQSVKTYDAAVKAATDKFNASDRGDAAKEAYDAEVEKAKGEKEARDNRIERFKKDLDEEYEEKKEAIDQYEETAEKERDEALKEQQIKDQIYDNELEIIQYEIQLKVDVSDTSVKILEELFDQLGDDADKAADRIANLQKQTEQYVNQADYYREGIEKILRHAGANDNLVNNFLSGNLSQSDIEQLGALGLSEKDAEALKDYQEKLLDLNQQYRDLKDEMMNEVGSAFDSFMDDLDRAAQKIEHLQKVTEAYKNIIDIVGKKILDPTGTLSNRLNRTSFEQARSLTQASKSELEFAEKSLAEAKKTRASLAAQYGDDDQIVKDWDKQIEDLEDKRDEAYENWLSNWEAECQAARDIYEDSMDTILTNFESKISGLAGSLDALSEAYERQSKIDEVYVDDYEKIYQLSKLSRQINASIDDTTQIKNKQQLKKLQEEINKAQEQGVKMSQYDLDVLQKKYDLEVARQQLEEAQNAKTKVTMQRDSEGNYGYVYTADSKAVADAEQSYEDKLHELQVLNSDYIKQLQSDMIQLQQECQSALQNFAENFKGSPEEYAKGVQAILDQYQTLMDAKYQQMGNAITNNRSLYENDWKAYSEATGYKISIDEDYIDKWGETNLSMITGYQIMGEAMEAWKAACEQTAQDSINAYQTWYEDTDTALKDGGTSMEDFKGTAEDVLTDVKDKTNEAAKAAKDMSKAYQTSFTEIINAAKEFCKNYKDEIEPAIALNDRLAEAIAKVLAEASKADSETNTGDTSGSGSGSGSGDSSSNSSGTETATPSPAQEIADMTAGVAEEPKEEKKKLTKKTKYGVALAIINGKDNHYGWGEDPERAKRLKAKFGASNGIQAVINALYKEGKVQNGSWVGKYSGLTEKDLANYAYSRFNTGGYTGAWAGNQGKLAVLDSKEIVLNKEDTENFLNAVDIVRDIANTIDLNAASASNGFARLFAAAGIKTPSSGLQQEVHITAEFPNVTNKNEILDAFDNVINLASQYANRK